MQFAVIILGYNDIKWLAKCLASVVGTQSPIDIIFVDNASGDGSAGYVRAHFPDIHVVESHINLGYAGGNNLGILRARSLGASHFILLNSDTWVEPDWVEHITDVFRDDDCIGAVTASIRTYGANTPDHSYKQILSATPGFIQDALANTIQKYYSTTTGSGAALAISMRFVEAVGWIDPVFFMYFEEIDWLRRGRLHGFKTVVSMNSIVHHFNHLIDPSEAKPAKIRFERGYMIFVLKNHDEPLLKSVCKFILEGPSRIAGALMAHQWKRAWMLSKVTFELFLKSPAIVRRRITESRRPLALPEMREGILR